MTDVPTPPSASRPPAAGGSGLEPNIAGALSYLLGAVTGVLFLIIDKDRPFVRFHALQSIAATVVFLAVYAVLSILTLIFSAIPILGWLVGFLLTLAVSLLALALWLYLMFKAFQGREWEVPWIGEQVRKYMVPGGPPGQT